jgi:hypothetical protein
MSALSPFIKNPNRTVEKAGQVSVAWQQHAPAASFAGMTLEQFREKIGASQTTRDKVAAAEADLRGFIAARATADVETRDVVALVVNSIKGSPEFGQNSQLYRACGYVAYGERSSGLTRRGTMPQPAVSLN